MRKRFSVFATTISEKAGQWYAFVLAMLLVIVWAVSGPFLHFSEVWQLTINTGTTIITFLMVFLIQNEQNRSGIALHAKLDELIRAQEHADNRFRHIERHVGIEEEVVELEEEVDAGSS